MPLDDDDEYQIEREDDLELLDASILEESQLDLRPPERSRTPEPLVYFADETKPQVVVPLQHTPQSSASRQPPVAYKQRNAWAEDEEEEEQGPSGLLQQTDKGDNDDVEEDIDFRFQAEAEELMDPNFQNEYSEECMDSLQIFYGSKKAKSKSRRENGGRFTRGGRQTAHQNEEDSYDDGGSNGNSGGFRFSRARSSPFERDESSRHDENDGNHRVTMKKLALTVGDSHDGPVVSSIAAYEQWGRSAAHDGGALHLEDASYDGADVDVNDGDDVGMRESSAPSLSESGILRELEWEAESSCDNDDSDDDNYTSLSEYEAEENFYSDDSDFYEENGTQYSDDFEDGEAEVIEYANDEFSHDDDSFDPDLLQQQQQQHPPQQLATTASARSCGGHAPTLSLSPTAKKQQKPPTEVQWVMRNVAQSLLQNHEDLTVA